MTLDESFAIADGQGYSICGTTGLQAATPLAANSILFAMRNKPQPAAGSAGGPGPSQPIPVAIPSIQIAAVRLAFTTLTAFTAPASPGRELAIFKGTTALPTGGSTDITPGPKNTLNAGADTGLDTGVAKIATTGGITVGAFVRGSIRYGTLDCAGAGAAGGRVERQWIFTLERGGLWLAPGELLVVSNPIAMDAVGTWQLAVEVDYFRTDF